MNTLLPRVEIIQLINERYLFSKFKISKILKRLIASEHNSYL